MRWVLRLPWDSPRRGGEIEMKNAQLAAIVESSNDAILSFNLDGVATSWNPAAERIFGYSADEIIGQQPSVFVQSEKADESADILAKIRKGQSIEHFETVRLNKDGRAVPVSMNIAPINDLTGAVIGASAIYLDITELKKFEMRNSMLAAIVATSEDTILSFTLNGLITSWNPAAERLYGYSAEEIIGQPLSILIPSEKTNDVAKILEKIRYSQSISNYETVRLRKDGSAIPVIQTLSPIYDSSGAPIGGSAICRDITELKKSETQNALLAAIVASSDDAIVSESLDGIINSWNPAAERLYGYSADEMIGQPFFVLVPSELADEVTNNMEKTKKGQPISNYETVRLRKDGSAVSVSMTISPVYDHTGAVVGGSVIYRDMTELKKSETQNALLAAIVASSDDAIVSESLDGIITSWNPAAERLYRYSPDEMIGQPFSILLPSERADELAELKEKTWKGQPIVHYETVRLRKDRSAVPVSINILPMYDPTGAHIGASTIYRDLTEFKRSQMHNALLAAIVASSDDAISSESLDGIITSWNPTAERIFGYTADEIIGQSFLILAPSGNADEAADILGKIRNGQPISNYETVRLKKDGSAIPVSMTFSPIYDPTGAISGMSIICQDITELKKSQMHNALVAAIVATSNDAITSFTLDGIVTSWNPAAERIFGYSAGEMIGQHGAFLLPSEKVDEATANLETIMNDQAISNFETVRLTKDGSAVQVSLSLSPLYDFSGALNGVSEIWRDITELKKAEHKFFTIVESAPDAIVIVDGTGIITIVNSQTEEIFDYRRDEMLGKSIELLIPSHLQADDPARRVNFIAQYLVQRKGFTGEGDLLGRRKDGREFPVEVSLSAIDIADGTFLAVTIRDVTPHKNMIRQLKEMNELRNEFVVIVAHDLRSPITSISGYAQELINEWDAIDDAKRIEYLHVIARNTEHLVGFVEEVLQVARIEAGEFAYDIRPFDIRSLVQRAVDETASAGDGRRVEFTAPTDFPNVLGDEDRQWQVLTNLLTNAVKFSQADQPIIVELSRVDDSVQVAVTDHGIGIAADDLSKLFIKFGRVGDSGVLKAPGNGLGLYICKTMVKAQGGRIWCESSPGRGSTFIFTIPIAQ